MTMNKEMVYCFVFESPRFWLGVHISWPMFFEAVCPKY